MAPHDTRRVLPDPFRTHWRPGPAALGISYSKERAVRLIRSILFLLCALALTSSASAQTKISASFDCNKADPLYVLPVPDREGFAFSMNQNKCTWTKGVTIEGLQPVEFISTTFSEIEGASGRSTAVGLARYDNGDRIYSRSTGVHDRKSLTVSGKWTYTAGTGKLLGIKGAGAYTCKIKGAEPGSAYACEVSGEYTMPPAKK
jgi:hypothetical protein